MVLNRKLATLPVTDPLWGIVEAVELDRCVLPQLAQLFPRLARTRNLEGAVPKVGSGADVRKPDST